MDIAIPVLLSLLLGPGVGQLYNKDYKKGGYLIGLSLVVLGGACVWFVKAMSPFLPPDLTTIDKATLQPFVENAVRQVVTGHGHTLATYQTILLVLWVYSVVDAYRVAQRRRAQKLSIQ
jgi:hypothetical protein